MSGIRSSALTQNSPPRHAAFRSRRMQSARVASRIARAFGACRRQLKLKPRFLLSVNNHRLRNVEGLAEFRSSNESAKLASTSFRAWHSVTGDSDILSFHFLLSSFCSLGNVSRILVYGKIHGPRCFGFAPIVSDTCDARNWTFDMDLRDACGSFRRTYISLSFETELSYNVYKYSSIVKHRHAVALAIIIVLPS